MVGYAGTIKASGAKARELPVLGIGWKIKAFVAVVVIAVLCWVIFTPLLLLAATAAKSMSAWLGF